MGMDFMARCVNSGEEEGEGSKSNLLSTPWTQLWGITGPPKVKLLGWKVFNDIVPTRANLRRRNILVDPPCPRCNREEENSVHVFFNCPWVRRVWRAWKIDIRRAVRDWRSCKDIIWNILQLPQIKEGEGGTFFLRMLWCIWNDRNKFLFENVYQ